MITLKNDRELDRMRRAGALLERVLLALKERIEPGITTLELDHLAERLIPGGGGAALLQGLRRLSHTPSAPRRRHGGARFSRSSTR